MRGFIRRTALPSAVLLGALIFLSACHPPETFPNDLPEECFTLIDSTSSAPDPYSDDPIFCGDPINEGARYWIDWGDGTYTYVSGGSSNCNYNGITSGYNFYDYEFTGCGAPDNRANWQHGDLTAVIYPSQDASGAPALDVYCVGPEGGTFGFQIPESVFTSIAATPAENTEVYASDVCGTWIKAYVLTTGEYQINITNPDGKIDVMIFEGMPPNNIQYQHIDPGA